MALQLNQGLKKLQLHDEIFMREALLEAKKSFSLGEVPVGAVLVCDGEIIARAHNTVETFCDASHHAEILCLQQAAKKLGSWRLLGATLYSTLEPCSMCAGAMFLFRIKQIVYGAPDLRHGADGSVFEVLSRPHPIHQIEVKKGVLAIESKALMQEFFRQRREENACRTV